MNSRDYLQYSAGALCLSLMGALPYAYHQYRLTNEAVREVAYSYRNAGQEMERAANQIKLTGFELRPKAKAFLESLNTQDAERGRLASMRSGESVARMAEEGTQAIQDFRLRLAASTGPKLDAAIDNYAALPALVHGEVRRAMDNVEPLAKESQETVRLLNQFLASPEMAALIPKIDRVLNGAGATTENVAQLAQEITTLAGKSQQTAEELTALLGDLRKAAQASERTLNEGTRTLSTVRKATLVGAITSVAGLLFK